MDSLLDMPHPLPLIVDDEHGKISMVKETCDIIGNIDKPVIVVAIAGIHSTGKSDLRRHLMGQELGSTVEAKTKGIWIWARDHPQVKDCVLILIDTEGLPDSKDNVTKHDIWIFVLAILLSNIFIFNSKGTTDNDSLRDLHLFTELANNLVVKSAQDHRDAENFGTMSPLFIWAVRDFFLDCEIDGNTATANEYLEWALALKPGHSRAITNANNIRSSIKTFFPKHYCYLFPDQEKFHQKFLDVSNEFKQFILSCEEPKQLAGKTVTGTKLVQMVFSYVEAFRSKRVPSIQDAVDMIEKVEKEKARDDARRKYDSHWNKIELPIENTDLYAIHSKAQELAMQEFFSKPTLYQDQREVTAFIAYLGERLVKHLQANKTASKDKSANELRKLYEPIETDLRAGIFAVRGGYKLYSDRMARFQEQYKEILGLGEEKNKVLDEFLTDLESQRKSILTADAALDELAQIAEVERLKREEQERQLLVKKEEIADMKDAFDEAIKSFEDTETLIKWEMEAKAELEKEELRKKMQKDKEESIRLLETFKEEAVVMRKNMTGLILKMENMVTSFRYEC